MIREELERIVAQRVVDQIGSARIVSIDIIREYLLDAYDRLSRGDVSGFPDLADAVDGWVPDPELLTSAFGNIAARLALAARGTGELSAGVDRLARVVESYRSMERAGYALLERAITEARQRRARETNRIVDLGSGGAEIEATDGIDLGHGYAALRKTARIPLAFTTGIGTVTAVDAAGADLAGALVSVGDPPRALGRTAIGAPTAVIRVADAATILAGTPVARTVWSLERLPDDARLRVNVELLLERSAPISLVMVAFPLAGIRAATMTGAAKIGSTTALAIHRMRAADAEMFVVEFDGAPCEGVVASFLVEPARESDPIEVRLWRDASGANRAAIAADYGVEL